jgi:hypothetical protein
MDLLTAALKDVILVDNASENLFDTSQAGMVYNATEQTFVHKCQSSYLLAEEHDVCQEVILTEISNNSATCRNCSSGLVASVDNCCDQPVTHLSQTLSEQLDSSNYTGCSADGSSLLAKTAQLDLQHYLCSGKLNDIAESDGSKKVTSFIRDQEENSMVITPVADKPKQSLLLRLFESKMFDMSIAIQYLFNSKEPGVLSYLGKCPGVNFK